MKIKVLLAIIMLFSLRDGLAQADSTVHRYPVTYFNTIFSGGLIGGTDKVTSLSVSTTHGVRFNRLAFGLGVGYDSYMDWKTVPFFASASFDIAHLKKSAFYIQANIGYAAAWCPNTQDFQPKYNSDGGMMFNPMIGYRVHADKFRLYLTAGYKHQQINYHYTPFYWWDSNGNIPPPITTVEMGMGRFVIQIGIGLN